MKSAENSTLIITVFITSNRNLFRFIIECPNRTVNKTFSDFKCFMKRSLTTMSFVVKTRHTRALDARRVAGYHKKSLTYVAGTTKKVFKSCTIMTKDGASGGTRACLTFQVFFGGDFLSGNNQRFESPKNI